MNALVAAGRPQAVLIDFQNVPPSGSTILHPIGTAYVNRA